MPAAPLNRLQDSGACLLLHAGAVAAGARAEQGGGGLAGAVGVGVVEAAAGGIQQIELLFRQEGEKGPGRTVTIASKQMLVRQELSKSWSWRNCSRKTVGNTAPGCRNCLAINGLAVLRPFLLVKYR